MFKDGPVYTRIAAQSVRLAELLNPIILFVYGLLLSNGTIPTVYKVNLVGLYIIMALWVILGLYAFFIPTKNQSGLVFRNVLYHILIGAYILFVTGLSSPFLGSAIVIMISAYVLSPKKAMMFSGGWFVLVAVIDTLIINPGNLFSDAFALLMFISAGSTIISIFQTQKVSQEAVQASKANEYLQRDRILTLVNSLTDAILSIDKEGIIRVYNAASLNLLDTNESLTGRHIDEIVPLVDKEGNAVSISKETALIKSPVKRDDLIYSISVVEKIRLEVTYAPIHSTFIKKDASAKSDDGYVVIMRDITKAKSLEEERDEFISVTSHELRTPLTIAEGTISNVQVMLDHPDITKKMIKDSISTAHDQVMYLANMVNDLSTLSRAERNVSDTAEDIDLNELAQKLFSKYSPDAKARGLSLDLDISSKLKLIKTNRLYLEELLQNFLTNAVKYTKKGGITIIFKPKGDMVLFAIKDTGIGISKSDQVKIYNKFYRSEDYRTRETGGTGLGLYIAAKLATKLETKIDLNSRLNFGSTFSFTLPVRPIIKKK